MKTKIILYSFIMLLIINTIAFGQTQKFVNATVNNNISKEAIGNNLWIGGVVGKSLQTYDNYDLKSLLTLAISQSVKNNPFAVQYSTVTKNGTHLIVRAQADANWNTSNCNLVLVNIYQDNKQILSMRREICSKK